MCLFLIQVCLKHAECLKWLHNDLVLLKLTVGQSKKTVRWGSFLTAVETTRSLLLFSFTALSVIINIIVIAGMRQPFFS